MFRLPDDDFRADLEELVEPDNSSFNPDFVEPTFFEVADKLVELYVTYRKRYVMMVNGSIFVPKRKETGPVPLSNSIVCKHLNKRFSIGVFAGEHTSKFICFDVDDGSRETVRKIISLCEQFEIPRDLVYVSSSGGKGYHVEVFFDNIVFTEKLRIFYDWVILHGKLDPKKVEFRPTHTQAIKLPLSKHAKTGNTCWFVNRDTFEPYTYDSYICSITQFSSEKFNELVDHCGIRKPVSGGRDSDYFESLADPNRPKTREITLKEQEVIDETSPYPNITEQGQRHQLTRYLAVRNRCMGMTMEESESALCNWWEIQDHTITTTPDKEALADIRDLVAWTFSDSFKIPAKKKQLKITKDILRAALSQKTKTERKLVFLIACYCDVYGRMNMSYDRIAKHLGCSSMAVQKMTTKLMDFGVIRYSQGRSMSRDGKFVRKPNTYWLNPECFSRVKALDVEWCFEEPLVYEAEERSDTDESGRLRTHIPELEPEGFTDFYYHIVRSTVSETSIKDFFTRSESEVLRNREAI